MFGTVQIYVSVLNDDERVLSRVFKISFGKIKISYAKKGI